MLEFSKQNNALSGDIQVQGDKEISYFSIILSALSSGKSVISGLLESREILNLIGILKQFGIKIEKKDNKYIVEGKGINGLKEPNNIINIGESEETLLLLVGLFSSYNFKLFFAGNDSLSGVDLSELFNIFKNIGINFIARNDKNMPFIMIGNKEKKELTAKIKEYNSIFKNVFLLSCLNNGRENIISESEKSKNHLEILMKYFGIEFEEHELGNKGDLSTKIGKEIILKNNKEFLSKDINIPSDISFSAFISALALLIPNSNIILKNVLMNQYRDAFYRTLIDMGANIEFINQKIISGEKVCDINVKYGKLNDLIIPANRIYKMLYEYPILIFISSIYGNSLKIQGLGILKKLDSKNYASMINIVKSFGITVEEKDDFVEINGAIKNNSNLDINTIDDSRLKLLFGMYGLFMDNTIKIPDSIENNFPNLKGFFKNIKINVK